MVEELRNKILQSYQVKIDDVLSFCESPIEKVMVLYLFNYCNSYRLNGIRLFGDVVFIDEKVAPFTPDLSQEDIEWMQQRIIKYNFREYTCFEKYIGFKAPYEFSESSPIEKLLSNILEPDADSIFFEIEVIPQKTVVVKDQTFRIDIAILLNRLQKDKVIEQKKIALECDGNEFHSTRVQIDRDNKRARLLNSAGWKVLRYSGRELNSIQSDEQFHQYFTQILDIFYS